jgi:hypothetical protein
VVELNSRGCLWCCHYESSQGEVGERGGEDFHVNRDILAKGTSVTAGH